VNAATINLRVALAGNPNCGKTSLFNALTGSRQKVGNYPGVTVEKKEGTLVTAQGHRIHLLDLPGTYSLDARTPDEAITRDVLLGKLAEEDRPDVLLAVADATNLEKSLAFVLELKELGYPVVLALNMIDLARRLGLELDLKRLSGELGLPVIPTSAVKKEGIQETVAQLLQMKGRGSTAAIAWQAPEASQIKSRFQQVDRILREATLKPKALEEWTNRIDKVVLHPVWGTLVLLAILTLVFQAVFNWASLPQDAIEAGITWIGNQIGTWLGEGALRSLLVDGIIAGVGSVVVFLPQILILFAFILALEDSGYMARAAFLMDRLMGRVGLHGRSFIPLLSSFACAIPGIMATRTIETRRDRLTTILVSPLMTCSARLPVYSLLIGAFIPNTPIFGPLRLQGLVMLGLYVTGTLAALLVAWALKKSVLKGPKPALLMELPSYKWPHLPSVVLGLGERAQLFLRRAGTVILTLSVAVWFLSSYPKAPEGTTDPAIFHSFAGTIGRTFEPLFRPIGFDWRIVVALIPGFAAREVMVSALGTVYAVEGADENVEGLAAVLAQDWSLATALSLLVWYIFASQCLSTLAVTRRETNSWKWPAFMLAYMTVLAYLGSFLTYQIVSRWML
jgi:ferrous iron transport protein B